MKHYLSTLVVFTAICLPLGAQASPLLDQYAAEAQKEMPDFTGFSAQRGQAFFLKEHGGGKPETPSCTSCHTKDPKQPGQTRAGKTIAPIALSQTPERFTDPAKVEKWFRRNCNSVLGRACTSLEKGDFITFMSAQ